MHRKELARWGIPALGFVGYVAWGGVLLALVFAGILFAVLSALIRWHEKDPAAYFHGMRVWTVLLLLVPAIGLTLGALATSPVLVVPALAFLALSVWLVRWTSQRAASPAGSQLAATAVQNLEAANGVTRRIAENNRRSHGRGAQLHAQAENLELIRKNADLEAQNVVLQQQMAASRREAALPPDPFADPIPQARSHT
jgi:hypothetical protein